MGRASTVLHGMGAVLHRAKDRAARPSHPSPYPKGKGAGRNIMANAVAVNVMGIGRGELACAGYASTAGRWRCQTHQHLRFTNRTQSIVIPWPCQKLVETRSSGDFRQHPTIRTLHEVEQGEQGFVIRVVGQLS